MNWKVKSYLQRCCHAIPGGGAIYNQFQRHLGGLRQPQYLNKFHCQKKMALLLLQQGASIEGAEVVEVGTGWIPLVPIGFWLCGAARTRTYDLNRYMEISLLRKALHWICDNGAALCSHYSSLAGETELRRKLEIVQRLKDDPAVFLREARIEYFAPADAMRTGLPEESIDIHFSANCLEHIPAEVLAGIMREARRVLKPDAVAVHHVDPSDHFSHFDRSITSINFLRFEPDEWARYSDNRFAYHNRLRDRDYRRIFENAAMDVICSEFEVDERAQACLEDNFPLARAYRGQPNEELCRYRLDYVARPAALVPDVIQGSEARLQTAK